MTKFFLPETYRENLQPRPSADPGGKPDNLPPVYDFAVFLATRSAARYVVQIGMSRGGTRAFMAASRLGKKPGEGLDPGDPRPVEFDLETGLPELAEEVIANSVVVAGDVLQRALDPTHLLAGLAAWSHRAKYVLLTTPARERARGPGDDGPPANRAHVREWTLDEFSRLLKNAGFPLALCGHIFNDRQQRVKAGALALTGREVAIQKNVPAVSVGAVLTVFNEQDILEPVVTHLLTQDIAKIVLVDNWSSDGSWEKAQQLAATYPAVSIMRFPDQPAPDYNWKGLLDNTEAVARQLDCDWVIHYDSDELRYSPWPGITLGQGISFIHSLGYSALDFTVIDFHYTQNQEYTGNQPVEKALTHFEFGRSHWHFSQVKAWKNQRVPVGLSQTGGHEVNFPGRKIFPLKFLLKHFSLRSRIQAETKVFKNRLPRFEREQKLYNWHAQYRGTTVDQLRAGWDACQLIPWSDPVFYSEYLVERLSGLGLNV
jgi:glycosyltransferase involved in cell wall biosynthesis